MRIDREVYKYIDYELLHFEDSKRELENLKMEIIETSSAPSDGQPRGNITGNPTEQKAMKLLSSVAIAKITKTINAIEKMRISLNPEYLKFFELNYVKKVGIVKICQEIGIEERTFYRWRDYIIRATGKELGLI